MNTPQILLMEIPREMLVMSDISTLAKVRHNPASAVGLLGL